MQNTQQNRREFMRVKASLHFCIATIEGYNEETGKYMYGSCFCTRTTDISLGRMCISHNGKVQAGFDLEISTPEKMTRSECLTCEQAYLHKNGMELQPMFGTVVWSAGNRCGIRFKNLRVRNENILSKFIWEEHLNGVRSNKEQLSRRKF